jgi:mercuric reductase
VKNYDFVILGGGSAAFAAATKASDLNLKIVLINAGLPMGGTCVNVGCVPSKHLLEAGNTLYYARHTGFGAVKATGRIDFQRAIQEKREVVEKLRLANYQNTLKTLKGVTFLQARATFLDRNTVETDGQTLTGKKFLIATGSSTVVPPIPGLKEAGYWTNVEALEAQKLPRRLLVLGAGPLGLEFAQMYRHFGSEVTVLQHGPQILPRTEPEIARALHDSLSEEGVQLVLEADAQEVRREGGAKVMRCKVRGEEREFAADEILVATGRRANTQGLGLEEAGVELDPKGFIKIDEHTRTTNPGIYAAGDCATSLMLETLAAKMGAVAVENAFRNAGKSINYHEIPAAVFTNPQVATVGYTEEEYLKKFKVCACRTLTFDLVPKAQVVKDTRGAIKMTVNPKTGVIMGVQICAPLAADMIHEATLAVKFKLTVDDLIDTTHVFPTLSEAIKKVAHAFKRDVSTMACCIE